MDLKGRRQSDNIVDAPPGTPSVPTTAYAKISNALSTNSAPSADLGGGSMDRAAAKDNYKMRWGGRTRQPDSSSPFGSGGSLVAHENKSYKMAAGGVVPDKWSALPSELRERNDTNFQQSKLLKKAISTNRKNPVNYQDEE